MLRTHAPTEAPGGAVLLGMLLHRVHGVAEMAPAMTAGCEGRDATALAAWMASYEVMATAGGRIRSWSCSAIAYVPLSAPLSTLESAQEWSSRSGASTGAGDQQPAAGPRRGRCHPARISWVLSELALSLGVVAVGWSVLIVLANAGKDD